ncbi:MAG: hypothetical protein ABW061_22110, partial [Polyangiaceae bacterium]
TLVQFMLHAMFATSLTVAEPRPRAWRQRGGDKKVAKDTRDRGTSKRSAPKKRPGSRAAAAARDPEGWQSRLREQSHNLARAIEMLEQALGMMSEPRAISLTRAECLRGAGLLTLLAASELLVVAGWFEADHAVSAGTLPR